MDRIMLMNIYFRVDASKEIGTGHVIRCVTLAKELTRLGVECIFLSRDHDLNLFEYITKNRFELRELKTDPEADVQTAKKNDLAHSEWLGVSQKYDASQAICALGTDIPNWLVVDHYGIDHRWHELIRPHCKNILVIDDLADRKHDCDLLLDQNLVMNYLNRYENLVASLVPKLLGPKFALLQEEYSEFKNRVPIRSNEIKTILVYFGGSDLHSLTESVVDTLMEILNDTVKVHVVSNNPSTSLINKVGRSSNFNLHSNLPSLAALMLKADLAIGASGTTTWERCFMGLPSIVVTTADNQVGIAKEMHAQGLIYWLGHVKDMCKEDLSNKIREILLDYKIISASSKKCMNLLDGLGANRVAQIMLLDESTELVARSVTTNDEELLLELRNDSEVRSNSFSSNIVDQKNHNLWFDKVLRSPEIHELFIIETIEGLPLGQVRFDKKNENWESSYSLFSYARRKNLGKKVFSIALKSFLKNKSRVNLYARVKSENLLSQKVLENNSFQPESHRGGQIIYKYLYTFR